MNFPRKSSDEIWFPTGLCFKICACVYSHKYVEGICSYPLFYKGVSWGNNLELPSLPKGAQNCQNCASVQSLLVKYSRFILMYVTVKYLSEFCLLIIISKICSCATNAK